MAAQIVRYEYINVHAVSEIRKFKLSVRYKR